MIKGILIQLVVEKVAQECTLEIKPNSHAKESTQ
jgi:hypothetical protein